MMPRHLQADLDLLKKEILTMGAMVEEATNKAISAFLQRRADLAREVIEGDDELDRCENEIEDHCLKTLALNQPVAGDLRFVVMVLKVNHDLERMGDLAVNIAQRTEGLLEQEPLPVSLPLAEMGERVRRMVRKSLDALVNLDSQLAREISAEDDHVDALHRRMFEILERRMREDSDSVERAVRLLSLSRYLERIADHTTNIAEDVVFMVEGEVIRHRHVLP